LLDVLMMLLGIEVLQMVVGVMVMLM